MAQKNKSDDIEKQTSMSTYLVKQIYQDTVAIVGSFGGAYAGLLAAKKFMKSPLPDERVAQMWEKIPSTIRKIPGFRSPISQSQAMWGALPGMFIGTLASGVILGYGHWKKIKQAQLQVDEITKDISDIEAFKKADPELKAENTRLWAELKKRDAAHGTTEKAAMRQKESWTESTQNPDASPEMSR